MRCVHVFKADSNCFKVSLLLCQEPSFTYQGNDLSRILMKFMGQLFIIGDEMGNVNIAVILLYEHILAYLISAIILVELRGSLKTIYL